MAEHTSANKFFSSYPNQTAYVVYGLANKGFEISSCELDFINANLHDQFLFTPLLSGKVCGETAEPREKGHENWSLTQMKSNPILLQIFFVYLWGCFAALLAHHSVPDASQCVQILSK